jgi:hypothetical protein
MTEHEKITQMGCAEFEEILADLDRPGTRGSTLRESALAHAESCERCAALMTRTESLEFALQAIATESAGAGAPRKVEAALMQEFRRRKGKVSGRGMRWRLGAIGAAAAVLLAAGSGISLRHNRTAHRDAGPVSVTETPAQKATTAERESQAAESEGSNTEYATEFVALPYADDPATLEGGTVVRVVLSRTALASLGVPVADVGAGEQIPADIVLSEDGAPQAIRLVSQSSLGQ